jgi:hypothetical protein
VAAGSFGAHGLKALLDATGRGDNWETAVRYCLYHALAILVLAVASALPQTSAVRGMLQAAGWKRNSMQIGDELLIEATLARDGSTNANARSVTLAATGTVLGAASSEQQTLTGGANRNP